MSNELRNRICTPDGKGRQWKAKALELLEQYAMSFIMWSYNLRGGSTDNLISHITEGAD